MKFENRCWVNDMRRVAAVLVLALRRACVGEVVEVQRLGDV